MRPMFGYVLAGVLAASRCSGGELDSGDGDQPRGGTLATGIDLFNERIVGSNPGCVTCHSLNEGVTLVGPSLFGLAGRAADQVLGQTAAQYVKSSIANPDEYIVPGFNRGQMVDGWIDFLTDEQIDTLVAALLNL